MRGIVGYEVVQLLKGEGDDEGHVVFFRTSRDIAEKLRRAAEHEDGKHPNVHYIVRTRVATGGVA